jgi:hypothetical protein
MAPGRQSLSVSQLSQVCWPPRPADPRCLPASAGCWLADLPAMYGWALLAAAAAADAAALGAAGVKRSSSLQLRPTVSESGQPGGLRSLRLGPCADVPGARDRIDGAWHGGADPAGRRGWGGERVAQRYVCCAIYRRGLHTERHFCCCYADPVVRYGQRPDLPIRNRCGASGQRGVWRRASLCGRSRSPWVITPAPPNHARKGQVAPRPVEFSNSASAARKWHIGTATARKQVECACCGSYACTW